MQKKHKPVVLIVMDGVGVNPQSPESTWRHASTPTFKNLEKFFPFTTLQASGSAVGLPWGEEGNSEVGHLTMGSGKIPFHHLPRIISSTKDGSFFKNEAFLGAINFSKKNNSVLHLIGLFSSGSVHAYSDHLYALLDFCKKENSKKVYLHLFTDGRDAPQNEGVEFFEKLEQKVSGSYQFAKIASIVGRDFAMDRDNNLEKIEKTAKCFFDGSENKFHSSSLYLKNSYTKGITDEFIEPASLESNEGRIQKGDAVIFFNFREDSMREIVSEMIKKSGIFFASMTEYEKNLPVKAAFPTFPVFWPISKILSDHGLHQLKIAETEKYAHVTYFFNGGEEKPFLNEDRILINSIKVKSFDKFPEMSASKIADVVIENLLKYDFILVNFANGDMVGHTGNFDATIKALEVVDDCVGRIVSATLNLSSKEEGVVVITADHGNAEEKVYVYSGEHRTEHNVNPVPFFIVANSFKLQIPKTDLEILKKYSESRGVLTDVAPTVLELLGLPKHPTMTGINLLPKIK